MISASAELAVSSLAEQRVLVTGASGFIGSRLCGRLLERGGRVLAISRSPRAGSVDGVRWEQLDLTDGDAVRSLIGRVRPDVVFHLASQVTGGRDLGLVLPLLQANLVGAVNVMVAAAEAGCRRLVLAGSMEEPELGDASVPQSPYAAAKWAAMGYARALSALYALPVVHLRIFMVYGPGQRDMRKLVPYVTSSLLVGETPRLMSGAREVDWIYVDDVVEALLAAAVAGGVEGSSLDVGSGELVTVRALVERLAAIIGGSVEPVFGALADRRLERISVADREGTAAALGWSSRTSLDEGLRRTVDYYRRRLGSSPGTVQ